MTKWAIVNYANCDCGAKIETMHQTFNEFPLTKQHENGLKDLLTVLVLLDAKDWISYVKIQTEISML